MFKSKSTMCGIAALFAMLLFVSPSVDADATVVHRAYGSYGGTIGPDGTVSCAGIPMWVCAETIINAYTDPNYPDHLNLLNSSGIATASFQGKYGGQIDTSAFWFDIP